MHMNNTYQAFPNIFSLFSYSSREGNLMKTVATAIWYICYDFISWFTRDKFVCDDYFLWLSQYVHNPNHWICQVHRKKYLRKPGYDELGKFFCTWIKVGLYSFTFRNAKDLTKMIIYHCIIHHSPPGSYKYRIPCRQKFLTVTI